MALLSRKEYGCTTTMLLARGVKIETINELIADGFATASTRRVRNGVIEIKRVKVTEAGRQVLLQRVAR